MNNSMNPIVKLKKLFKLAIPLIATNGLKALNSTLTILWIGHFIPSSDGISGVTLGTLVFNIFGLSTLYGLASGLSTLLAQAEGAGRNTNALRALHVKRVSFVLIVAGVILGVASSCAEPILIAMGQPNKSALIAGVYSRVIYWGSMLPTMINYVQQSVLNTRRHTKIPLIATAVATAVHIVIALFFLRGFKEEVTPVSDLPLGDHSYLAPAIARIAFSVISAGIVGFYLIWTQDPVCSTGCLCYDRSYRYTYEASELTADFRDVKKKMKNQKYLSHMRQPLGGEDTRPLPPVFQWNGFRTLLALCLPSMFMMIAEWWSFEFLSLMAGWLSGGALDIAANGVMYSLAVFTYQIYRGMGSATGILVGNALGSSSTLTFSVSSASAQTLPGGISFAASCAKRMCWIGIASTAVIATIISIVAYYCRHHLGEIMTQEPDIVAKVADASIPLILAMFGYALLMPSIQILQGCALQKKGAIFTAVGYYLVGLPSAAVMAFPCEWGLSGIWYGNAAALWSASFLSMGYLACYVDWEKEVQKAIDRMNQEKEDYDIDGSTELFMPISQNFSFEDGIFHKNSSMYF